MSETKFTPGPWQFWAGNVFGTGGRSAQMIADVAQRHAHTPDCEDCANAHLIAAAPELYEALEEVVAISDRKHDAWDKAHAALAKARGEQA